MTDPSAPITTTASLKLGDVVQIAVQLQDKSSGRPFWWRRFACVTRLPIKTRALTGVNPIFEALTLKLHPDEDKDRRHIDLTDENQVVTIVPEASWPQGVVAIRMKLIMQGKIRLEEV